MTRTNGGMKLFTCCRKDSICLKLWILILVCSLLCFTCMMIENRRPDRSDKTDSSSHHGAQKLIQIITKLPIKETSNDVVDEGSGDFEENFKLAADERIEENLNDVPIGNAATNNKSDLPLSQEITAASNCTRKGDGTFKSSHISERVFVADDNYDDDLGNDVEKLAEYPEFSETQAQGILVDCDSMPEMEISLEQEPQNDNREDGSNSFSDETYSLPDFGHGNEAGFQLSAEVEETPSSKVNWEPEDRFFPDEYAFKTEFSNEPTSMELITEYGDGQPTASMGLHEKTAMKNVDIPKMINSFFGKISTLLAPSAIAPKTFRNSGQLTNLPFNNKIGAELMKPASSQVYPVWRVNPNTSKVGNGNTLKPNVNSKYYANSQRRPNGNNKTNYNGFLEQLLKIKAQK